MSDLSELLARSNRPDELTWEPIILDPSVEDDRRRLEDLLASGAVRATHDTLRQQLGALVESRAAQKKLAPPEVDRLVEEHLAGTPLHDYGRWVHYPWSGALVHILPEHEFRELRTSCNRNKVTLEEQQKLRTLRLGIAGLSVGRATAVTLALEEIGAEYRLADFDHIELQNLNRLRAGVQDLGMNKAILTAREIKSINPYAHVVVYPNGIREDVLDSFMTGLDILFEEIDGLDMKVRMRERARDLGVAVLMETSDRGMLDIERFDLQPDRPIFHGLAGDLRASELEGLTTYEKVPTFLKVIGARSMSRRMAASLIDIDTTLKSWPQVAAAVALGGAVNTEAARQIGLGGIQRSGRVYLDMARRVRIPFEPLPGAPPSSWSGATTLELPTLPPDRAPLSDVARSLVAYATLAPSGGNCQPWRFTADAARVQCWLDRKRGRSLLDFGFRGSRLACGAALANLAIAARRMGFAAAPVLLPEGPDSDLMFELSLREREAPDSNTPLFDELAQRCTNRKIGEYSPLSTPERELLMKAASENDAKLVLLENETVRTTAGELIAAGDRIRFLSPQLHKEMFDEVRWTAEDARRTRDGLDLPSLELDPTQLAGLDLTRDAGLMAELRRIGGGQGLGRGTRKAVQAASAVGLLSVSRSGASDYLRGGSAVQYVWLRATQLGLAFQPMTVLVYLFKRLGVRNYELDSWTLAELQRLQPSFVQLFDVARGDVPLMIFRVARSAPPTSRSLRRPVHDVLELVPS